MRPSPGTQAETVSLAQEAVKNKDWTAARDLWQLCVDNYSTGEQPWWDANLGRALIMNHELDRAEKVLVLLCSQHPEFAHGHIQLAALRLRQKQFKEAAVLWRFCIDNFSDKSQSDWQLNLAYALRKSGDLDGAEEVYEYLVLHYPDMVDGYVGLAQIYTDRANWEFAIEGWQFCIQLFDDGEKPDWHMNYIVAAIEAGKVSQANAASLALIKSHPDYLQGRFKAVETFIQLNRPEEAASIWKDYTDRIEPARLPQFNAGVCAKYALLSSRLEFWKTAESAWQVCFRDFSESIEDRWLVSYGRVLLNLGKFDDARGYLHLALDSETEKETALSGLIATCYNTGKYDESLDYSDKLWRVNPEDTEGYYWARESLIKLGRFNEARLAHDRYVKVRNDIRALNDPDRPESLPENLVLPDIRGSGNDYSFLEPLVKNLKSEDYSLKASLIIPVYNRIEMLAKTLAGLVHQSYPADLFEVIIADDGSTDHPQKLVKVFEPYFQIKIIHQQDLGFRLSAVRNLGMRAASNDYIIMLDSDVVPGNKFIESFMRRFHVYDKLAMFGLRQHVCIEGISYQEIIDDPNIHRRFPEAAPDWFATRTRGDDGIIADFRVPLLVRSNNLKDNLFPFQSFSGCSQAFPKWVIKEVGGYDEEFQSWGKEDIEFGYRLYNEGFYFVPLDDALGFHQEVRSNSNSFQADRSEGSILSLPIAIQKCPAPILNGRESGQIYEVPKVSIFITTYNAKEYIEQTINSVLDQSISDLEIVVCDDGSNDQTRVIVRTICSREPRVCCMEQQHKGVAIASYNAVLACRGMYIVQLRATDLLERHAIERMVEVLDSREFGMVYGRATIVSSVETATHKNGVSKYSREHFLDSVIGAPFRMFRKRDWSRIRGYDASMGDAMDYDLTLQLSEVCPIGYVPQSVYYPQSHEQSLFDSDNQSHVENRIAAINNSLSRMELSDHWVAKEDDTGSFTGPVFIELNP